MKLFACLLCCGWVLLASSNSCGELGRLKLKSQWARIFTSAKQQDEFASSMWASLFEQTPELLPMFSDVQSDDQSSAAFRAHAGRVLSGIDRLISVADLTPTLLADAKHLQEQHAERGITAENFQAMKEALIATAAGKVGVCFDKTLWSDCFDVFAKLLLTPSS